MNYIGSKQTLLPFIEKNIKDIIGEDIQGKTLCDLFAGTGAVGKYFKRRGAKIISNDIQYYSYVLNKHYIGNSKELSFDGLVSEIKDLKEVLSSNKKLVVCNYLDNLSLMEGFIYKNYCKGDKKDSYRLYFSDDNGKKCDTIRLKIEEWKKDGKITDNEYFFLLSTLIENIDKVANTASVYGAFLKKIKKTAEKDFYMIPSEFYYSPYDNYVYNEDSNTLIKKIYSDILYLDPPYNHRQYSSNYHLIETIAKYDNPKIKGKTGMRENTEQKSSFCYRKTVLDSFEEIIMNANTKYVFLSYNDEGLMSFDDIKEIMSKRGVYGYFKTEYNRFRSDVESDKRKIKRNKTIEYLHYLIVKD